MAQHELENGSVYARSGPSEDAGLRNNGQYVRNVFAYDSTGKTLTGVQLYDAKGRPLPVRAQQSEMISRRAWDSARPPALPSAPLAVVPPAAALETPPGPVALV